MGMIWDCDQAKYFSTQDWTTQITLMRFRKLRFGRMRFYGASEPSNAASRGKMIA